MVYSIWEKHSIRCVTNIITKGATPTTYGYDFVEHGEDAIRFIGAYNCSIDGRFKSNSDKWITTDANKMIKRSILESGDSIFCIVGNTIGSSFKVTRDILPANINQNVALIRPDQKKINEDFLHYYLRSTYIQWQVQQEASIQAQPSLSLQQIGNFKINVPPLSEQIKIAEILSTWDNAINTVQKLLANSQQQKKSLMQQLLTGKKRFSGFEGEWDNKKLENVLYEESPRNKGLSISRVLSITNHSGFVLPQDQFSKRVASDDVSNYKVIKKGQFGYNPSRLNVGSFARLNDYDLGILSPMYVVFSLKEDKLCSDYFLFWMQSNEARQRVLSGIQGSVRASVGFDDFAKFSFKLPSLAEQQKIATILTTADQEIDNLRAQLNHLKQEKKALMQQLLTGKRRVKIEEAA